MLKYLKIIFQELFYVLTGALVIFCAMELVWERIVLSYININWVLILWLFCGMVLVGINNDLEKVDSASREY